MYLRVAIRGLLAVGIILSLSDLTKYADAADTILTGYVYEFDDSFKKQEGLGNVTVTVQSKEGTLIDSKKTDDKSDKGRYEIRTTSEKDPLIFIYSLKGYNPYPKRVVQNDLRKKMLDSIALVKIRDNPKNYGVSELVHLSQGVVEVMLIFRPSEDLMKVAISLSEQLSGAEPERKAQAVIVDPSTFYNIDRLMPSNRWLKEQYFDKYLDEFKTSIK